MKKLVKRSAALLFTVALVMSMLVVPASAAHSHDSSYWEKGRCGACGAFLPLKEYVANFMPTYFKVANGQTAYMREYPYAASDSTAGFVYALQAGTRVIVTESVVNGFGNVWQRVWYDNRYGYIVADKLVPANEGVAQTIFIDKVAAPSGTLAQGRGFSLYGNITSQSKLTNVSVYIYYANSLTSLGPRPKESYHDYSVKLRETTSYNMHTDGPDRDIRFGELPKGDYVYVVTAMSADSVCPWPLVISDFSIK